MRLHRTRQEAKKKPHCRFLFVYLGAVALTICSSLLWHSVGHESISSSLLQATLPIPLLSTVMPPAPWTIFYNVHIAPEFDDADVLTIVEEQVDQIRSSAVVSSRPEDTSVILYFVTIGREDVVTQSAIDSICGTDGVLQCIHLKHYSEGFQEVTLKEVHSHCQRADANTSVIYIHNKGSHEYPASKALCSTQTRWRQRMTEAVSTKECLTSLFSDYPSTSCDVCGLLFQTIPSMHFPGNSWTARCDYVKKLLEPTEYAKELQAASLAIREQVNNGTLTADLYSLSEPWVDGDRQHAMQGWVASHPDLQSCDVSATPSLRNLIRGSSAQSTDFEWALAPRRVLRNKHWQIEPRPSKSAILTKGRTDMFLLPGQMQKWSMIYGKLPDPESSWVYSHFPEGEYWRSQVLEGQLG